MKKKEIITERLVLKSLRDSDMDNMLAMLKDSKINQTYMIPDFKSEEEAKKFFLRLKKASESEEHFIYGIFLNDEVIGFLNDVSIEGKEIEIGYFISSSHWNKGYASEAFKAIIDSLFELGFYRVVAAHFENNTASGRVMQKCGMTRFDKEEYIEWRGINHRCIYYEIINPNLLKLIFIDAKKYDVSYLKTLEYLTAEDLEEASKYKQEISQKEKLVSNYLKRKYVGKDIYINEHGKPLSDEKYFNISHSKGMVCLAIANSNVGVDIEFIRKAKEDIRRFISNDDEYAFIHNDESFYAIWTLKEAISKADGEGLKTKVSLIPSLPIEGMKLYKNKKYYTRNFKYKNYMVSIAVEREDKFDYIIEEKEL